MASLVIMTQRPTLMVRWVANLFEGKQNRRDGGAGGIRTLDRALQPYNGLANRRLQPLGHSSVGADMPDTGASRKRPIARRRIPGDLTPARRRAIAARLPANPEAEAQ